MTLAILKSSIHVLDAFNDVRNNNSLAHDNKIISYAESILILNDIANLFRFVEQIELDNKVEEKQDEEIRIEDIPF